VSPRTNGPAGVHPAPAEPDDGIPVRTGDDFEGIRAAARVVEGALARAFEACSPGVRTSDLEGAARESLEADGARPLFQGYRQGSSPPFPGVACVSINEEVVHGVPGARRVEAGDLVTIDIGAEVGGWCADLATSRVMGDGPGAEDRRRLARSTRGLMATCVGRIRPGVRWSDLAGELEERVEAMGFGIVTEYVGHGLGRSLHERPKVPAYRSGFTGDDFVLRAGMVIALEPILTLERGRRSRRSGRSGLPPWRMPVRVRADGWTVEAATGTPACHEEWMLGVVEAGCEILGRAPAGAEEERGAGGSALGAEQRCEAGGTVV